MPPRARLLSIGNELLLGLTLDTNAHYLANELGELGWSVTGIEILPDEVVQIASAIRRASGEAELLVLTGGLGPTADDRTREAIALALGATLEERPELVAEIEGHFRRFGRPMRPINRVQALLPVGATAIQNRHGTAPGIRVKIGAAELFAVPGVPREMRALYTEAIAPFAAKQMTDSVTRMRRLHLFGVGESTVGEAIAQLMTEAGNPSVGTSVQHGLITVRFRATGATEAEALAILDGAEVPLRAALGEHIYGRDEESLASSIVSTLREHGETLALAESCTGGMLAAEIVGVSGASKVLIESLVSYANAAKERRLGVPAALLAAHGAVSAPVAKAMAEGARSESGSTYALAVTGVAGPDGGTAEKPVGTVFIALAGVSGTTVIRQTFLADRLGNRWRAVHTALDLLRRQLHALPSPWEVVSG